MAETGLGRLHVDAFEDKCGGGKPSKVVEPGPCAARRPHSGEPDPVPEGAGVEHRVETAPCPHHLGEQGAHGGQVEPPGRVDGAFHVVVLRRSAADVGRQP
jgi:hypothetical protein